MEIKLMQSKDFLNLTSNPTTFVLGFHPTRRDAETFNPEEVRQYYLGMHACIYNQAINPDQSDVISEESVRGVLEAFENKIGQCELLIIHSLTDRGKIPTTAARALNDIFKLGYETDSRDYSYWEQNTIGDVYWTLIAVATQLDLQ